MITIFIGDNDINLSIVAKTADPNAQLIQQVQTLMPGTYYTSLSDLHTVENLIKILDQADSIVYNPPKIWSDLKNGFSHQQCWIEFYCMYFNDKKTVIGLDNIETPHKVKMLELVDERKTSAKQLWVAGCSISHGIGVDKSDRYGEILSKKLNLSVSFLTQSGASIGWAVDQLLRSDIKPNDIIVLGITSTNRFTFMDNDGDISHVNTRYYEVYPEFNKVISLDILSYETNNNFSALKDIHKLINFCFKTNVKLVLAGLLIDYKTIKYFYDLPNYTQCYGVKGLNLNNIFLDLGTDNRHPGPKSHQYYAECIYKKLQNDKT